MSTLCVIQRHTRQGICNYRKHGPESSVLLSPLQQSDSLQVYSEALTSGKVQETSLVPVLKLQQYYCFFFFLLLKSLSFSV